MEIAAAAFSALTATASTVGGALGLTGGAASSLGGAAAGGLGGLLGGSSWLTLLQGGSMALSAAAALSSGQEKSDSLMAAASDAQHQAGLEQLAGTQRQASLKRAAADQMGERDAAYAASGIDLSFGTPQIAKAQDIADTERALSIDQSNTAANVGRLQDRAANYARSARSARSSSVLKAIMTGADGVLGINKRGVL